MNRTVEFGGAHVVIEYDESAHVAVELVCRHLAVSQAASARRIHIGDFLIESEGRDPVRKGSSAELAEVLMRELTFHLTDQLSDQLVFHAGLFFRDRRAFLLPGLSGSGKSTLSAMAALRGLTYGSDELVLVPVGKATARGLSRPLHLKPGSAALIADCPDALRFSQGAIVDPALLGGKISADESATLTIVCPRYAADCQTTLVRLSPADTAHRLMQVLLNARALPGHGLSEVVRLSRLIAAYSLDFSDPNSALDSIQTL